MKKKSANKKKPTSTFQALCEDLQSHNVAALITRAALANRVAHSVSGPARQTAYTHKHAAMLQLMNRVPCVVELSSFEYGGAILGVRMRTGVTHAVTLHIPRLTVVSQASAWLAEEYGRGVAAAMNPQAATIRSTNERR